ncbi:MAG: diguanylate cyclase [Acidobacteria bacterium]|nr:MAG: diguanylate cyclase [Acidobacteriota bacterium]
MKICIPVEDDNGLKSRVCQHFGSAPAFAVVDTESGNYRAIVNRNQHHGHGMCAPLASLEGEQIDAMVVGGIGMGALNRLNSANIQVYLSENETVAETLEKFQAGSLKQVMPNMACGHHGHGHARR